MTDDGILQTILDNPADDTSLLVYADWLEEQGDTISSTKAEFLRLTVEHTSGSGKKNQRKKRRQRLQQFAISLDTAWLAIVSRLPIESCQGKREKAESEEASYALTFDYRCDRRWEDLNSTDEMAIRFCDACQHNVHYCDTIMEARKQASAGHCIAVDLGVIRREGDLLPAQQWMGMLTNEGLREYEELRRPDPVSAERERKKRSLEVADPRLKP
jgi:uncharacterized protein (TIGR02996 family)